MANVGFRVYFLGCIYISPMEPMGNHGVTYVFLVRTNLTTKLLGTLDGCLPLKKPLRLESLKSMANHEDNTGILWQNLRTTMEKHGDNHGKTSVE